MTTKHIYFLNGPPRSGKDTVGRLLQQQLGGECVKMATALKRSTHALFCALLDATPSALAGAVQNPEGFEHQKDESLVEFLELSPRQAYIAVSERLFKPLFGEEFFGQVLGESIARINADDFFITDSGFTPEARPIIRSFGAGNCTLIRLHRDGCDFSSDSRDYIELEDVESHDVENNGTVLDLQEHLVQLFGIR